MRSFSECGNIFNQKRLAIFGLLDPFEKQLFLEPIIHGQDPKGYEVGPIGCPERVRVRVCIFDDIGNK